MLSFWVFILFVSILSCDAFVVKSPSLSTTLTRLHRVERSSSTTRTTTSRGLAYNNDGLPNVPFFASEAISTDSNIPTVTTRLPLGTLLDSRDYIFCTRTNVRSYEWTRSEVENLWQDLVSVCFMDTETKYDFELSQIILVPMEWDRSALGLGARYDVYDGQQRLVTLCLLLAAIQQSLQQSEQGQDGVDMEAVIQEISNMLHPTRARKEDVWRMELNLRDNVVFQQILKHTDITLTSPTHERMWKNYQLLLNNCVSTQTTEQNIQLLDFLLEHVYLLVCVPETSRIARNIAMGQNKGMNNEPIDDFKGIVSFRYTMEEKDMYSVFDAWDNLASSPIDLENEAVGRKAVADACMWRATIALQCKIRSNDPLLAWELWLRNSNCQTGKDFFEQHIQPSSLLLGQFRNDNMPFLSSSSKLQISLTTRLNFLRQLIQSSASAKETEMVVLDLLLKTTSQKKKENKISLGQLDVVLSMVEKTALWMTLAKPSAAQRYNRWFAFLESVNTDQPIDLSEEEASFIQKELQEMDIGATAAGKRLAAALLQRIQQPNDLSNQKFVVEHVLPVKRHNAYWKKQFPSSSIDEYMHKFGNLVLVTKKPTARQSNQSFLDKQKRYEQETDWSMTQPLSKLEPDWNSSTIRNQQDLYMNQIQNLLNI